MQRSSDSFFAVRIDFGDYVRNLQYTDRRTAELVLQQSRIQYGYDNAALVEIKYWSRTRQTYLTANHDLFSYVRWRDSVFPLL